MFGSTQVKKFFHMVEKDKISNIAIARLMYAVFDDEARPFIIRLLSKEELLQFLYLNFQEKWTDEKTTDLERMP